MRREESLNSSAISSAGWDDETRALDVTFASGQTYTFQEVPQEIWEGLVTSPSPGRFYHQFIKGFYG